VCGTKYMVGEEADMLEGSKQDERDEDRDNDGIDGRDENEGSDGDGDWDDGRDGDRDEKREEDEDKNEVTDKDRDGDGDERRDRDDDLLKDALPCVSDKSETLRSASSPSVLSSTRVPHLQPTLPRSTSFSPLSLSPLVPSALFPSPLPLSRRSAPVPLSKILIAGGKYCSVCCLCSVLCTARCLC
jgi:hypothetical protein